MNRDSELPNQVNGFNFWMSSGDSQPDKWLTGGLTHILTPMTCQETWHMTCCLADTWSDPYPAMWPNVNKWTQKLKSSLSQNFELSGHPYSWS